jgi:6-pyruvoyltetrahydropterin/6-carboxytetrahydropterin synthase
VPIRLERSYRFSAAHRYFRPEWSEEQNFERFGRCSWAPGHGHNYRLTLWIEGAPETSTGFVVDLGWLDALVREHVLDRLDHRQIDHSVEEFRPGGRIPTSENLAEWIARQIAPRLPALATLRRLRLAEDDDLAAEWAPDFD